LPVEVLEQLREEMLDWRGQGMSVMEMSHRGKAFVSIAQQAEADLRELLAVPSNYKVLFLQGGATAPTGEAAVLRIERDELLERVASISARNVPREYELTYVVRYSLSLGGQTRIDAEEVSVSRDFTFDETAALAKDRERDLLREALARELSGVVLARLASVR
jgi:hypothetical protein